MRKLVIGMALALSTAAHAQTSTTSLPEAASTSASAPPASPTQTVSTSIKEEESALRKKVSATAYFNFAGAAGPINDAEMRKDAEVTSENYLALSYKLSETQKIQLRHNFGWTASGPENGKYTLIDPALGYSVTGPKMGVFEPLATSFLYYMPFSETSRLSHRAGVLRADVSADYNATTRLVLTPFISPRLTINTNGNDANVEGSDSKLRFIGGGSATYNFNDYLNVYYSPYVDLGMTDHNRGTWTANLSAPVDAMKAKGETWNVFVHEMGMGVNITKTFSITPAVINYVSMNDGEGFGREEYLEYDLYVSATF